MVLKIDDGFRSLCRKLTEDEFNQLEENIRADGCLSPILIWDETIIDGHNRYEICRKHGIHYNTARLSFRDRDEAVLWIINNQLGRRNLSPLDRVELLEAKRPILEKQAKERQKAGGGDKKSESAKSVTENFTEPIGKGEVAEQLAKEAGVSRPVYNSLRKVNQSGTDELKQAVREKKVSASAGAKIAKLPKEEQKKEVDERETQTKKKKLYTKTFPVSDAWQISSIAICQLERIRKDDPKRNESFDRVITWIERNRS